MRKPNSKTLAIASHGNFYRTAVLAMLSSQWMIVFIVQSSAMAENPDEKKLDARKAAFRKIEQAISKSDHKLSVKLLNDFIAANPNDATAYYWRGRENYRIAEPLKSVQDFDKYVSLNPRANSRMWERGISCYYAGKFKEGVKQFELYQTFHGQDVENGVWHILCKSKLVGFEEATKDTLDIQGDRRVPMKQIYEMFRGKLSPDDVMKAAQQPVTSKAAQNAQLFYGHLYVGLYYDVNNDPKKMEHHLQKAFEHKIEHYMGDVARVHLRLLKKQAKQKIESP